MMKTIMSIPETREFLRCTMDELVLFNSYLIVSESQLYGAIFIEDILETIKEKQELYARNRAKNSREQAVEIIRAYPLSLEDMLQSLKEMPDILIGTDIHSLFSKLEENAFEQLLNTYDLPLFQMGDNTKALKSSLYCYCLTAVPRPDNMYI